MKQPEDEILIYISEHGIAHPKDIRNKFPETDIILAKLKSQKLITNVPGKLYSVSLTDEGIKACDLGFANWTALKRKKEEKELQYRHFNKRYTILMTIIALISAIIAAISLLT